MEEVLDEVDCSSLSSITTLTETPSQKSLENSDMTSVSAVGGIRSPQDTTLLDQEGFGRKLESFINLVQQTRPSPKQLENHCRELKESYLTLEEEKECYHDVEKLKKLASRYSALLLTVDQKSRNVTILAKANQELNQYISNMENYHAKQVGSLKAKISLTRIENEVRSNSSIGSPNHEKSQQKLKKKRSSFWRRFSKSSSNINELSASTSTVSEIETRGSLKMQDEILKKTVLIEELQKQCADYEQREKILEEAIHNKNVEISLKNNRVQKLKKELESHISDRECLLEVTNQLEGTVVTTNLQLKEIESEMKENRTDTKGSYLKVQKLEWILHRLNEENKILLTKINTRNYEVSCQKLKNEQLVLEVKKQLLSMINMTYGDRDTGRSKNDQITYQRQQGEEEDEEDVLKHLLYILKENISRAFSEYHEPKQPPQQYKTECSSVVDKSCQTTNTPINTQIYSSSRRPERFTEERVYSKQEFDSNERITGIYSKPRYEDKDSGLSINEDEASMLFQHHQQQLKQQRRHMSPQSPISSQQKRPQSPTPQPPSGNQHSYQRLFDENTAFTRDFLGYVEYMKNREISGYKEVSSINPSGQNRQKTV